jgi:hypothetical protein
VQVISFSTGRALMTDGAAQERESARLRNRGQRADATNNSLPEQSKKKLLSKHLGKAARQARNKARTHTTTSSFVQVGYVRHATGHLSATFYFPTCAEKIVSSQFRSRGDICMHKRRLDFHARVSKTSTQQIPPPQRGARFLSVQHT